MKSASSERAPQLDQEQFGGPGTREDGSSLRPPAVFAAPREIGLRFRIDKAGTASGESHSRFFPVSPLPP